MITSIALNNTVRTTCVGVKCLYGTQMMSNVQEMPSTSQTAATRVAIYVLSMNIPVTIMKLGHLVTITVIVNRSIA